MLVRCYYGWGPDVWCAVPLNPDWSLANHGIVAFRAPSLLLVPLLGFASDDGERQNCLRRKAAGQYHKLQHAWAIGILVEVNGDKPAGSWDKVSYSYDTGNFSVGKSQVGTAAAAYLEPIASASLQDWQAGETGRVLLPPEKRGCCGSTT